MSNDLLTGQALQDEIIATINNMAAIGDWVYLTHFIGELHATRDDIAKALAHLDGAGIIALAPESNTKLVTRNPRVKRDAIRLGGEDMHMVCVQPSW